MISDIVTLTTAGIAALKHGDHTQGRSLLIEAVKQEPCNLHAWLWLSETAMSDDERRYCLQRVLTISPDHPAAQRGLSMLAHVPRSSPTDAPPPAQDPAVSEIRYAAAAIPTQPPARQEVIDTPRASALRPMPTASASPTPALSSRAHPPRRSGIALLLISVIIAGAIGVGGMGGWMLVRWADSGGTVGALAFWAPTVTPVPTATPAPTATPQPTCAELANAYVDEIKPLLVEWDDSASLANSTARIALPQVIPQLQQVRRQLDRLTPPACARGVHGHLVNAMDYRIKAFISFMGQEDDLVFTTWVTRSSTELDSAMEELKALMADSADPQATVIGVFSAG
ncbi:MAG: hypothetical protein WCG26_07900 [Chloroflexales bacterium]